MTIDDDKRSVLERATREIRRLRDENTRLLAGRGREGEGNTSEAIAIIGLACRLPGGVENLDDLWRLLSEGGDPIVEIPRSRWPSERVEAPLRGAHVAGLLTQPIECFDARFFAIAGVEARSLDPQQRLLLELAWESFEDAGVALDRLASRRVGVFVGVSNLEHRERVDAAGRFDAYSATGNLHSSAAGRISHCLDLQGPCITVDTACSSSLVAIELAIQSLRRGECELAVAGGVQVLLSPAVMAKIAAAGLLAADGRCKSFDRAADGFVRSEGGGLVLLRRESEARRGGDRIRALLRGAAVNHNGHSSSSSVPNPLAQARLLRAALADAGLEPEQISHVEANGTGTALGDPIEVDALREVYGARADREPCWIGTAKAQLGHMEAAAGVCGLLKVIASLDHEQIPAQHNLEVINPKLGLTGSRLQLASSEVAWPRTPMRPRRAGVSAFGIAGTNAHVIVEEAPLVEAQARPRPAPEPLILPISARDPQALAELLERYAALLRASEAEAAAIVYSATIGRSHGPHRLALIGRTKAQLCAALEAAALDRVRPPAHARPQVVLVIPERLGSVRAAAGRLAASEPAFAKAIAACETAVRSRRASAWSFVEALAGEPGPLASWAFTIALVAALAERGVVPDVLLGVGPGEIAAAQLAGVVGVEQAVQLLEASDESGNEPRLRAPLGELGRARCEWISTLTGARIDGPELDERLFAKLRSSAGERLDSIIAELAEHEAVFVEIDLAPTLHERLEPSTQARLAELGRRWIAGIDGADDWGLAPALAGLYEAGHPPSWIAEQPGREQVALPRYPWQRERHWIEIEVEHVATAKLAQARERSAASEPATKTIDRPSEPGLPLFELAWSEATIELEDRTAELGPTLILEAEAGAGRALADRLGAVATRRELARGLDADEPPPRVIVALLPGCASVRERDADGDPVAAALAELQALVELIAALLRRGDRDPPRLVLITRGAVDVAGRAGEPERAPSWGVGRCLMHEHPELRCALIDLDPTADASELEDPQGIELLARLIVDEREDQIALRRELAGLRRLVARLRRADLRPRLRPAGGRPFALEQTRLGTLAGLQLCARARSPLGPDEVEIEVEAAGLNFLDVLLALDALGLEQIDTDLGRECAGRISAIGSAVENLEIGAPVIALAHGCFATHVRARAMFVVPRPPQLDAAAAAALPIASLTAVYGLEQVARLEPGERVLIHAAAGGVGQYAVQLAQARGAEIFATAGSEAKRALLRRQGITHVASSRDDSFVELVRDVTAGRGVDVVLNCLAGPLLRASVDLLGPDGRFVELGKRDYAAHARIDTAPFLRRLSWTLVDLDGMQRERPERMQALLELGAQRWASGELRPIEHERIPILDARAAFERMARGGHTGKLVLDLAGAAELPIAPPRVAKLLSRPGVVLVTGANSALAQALAWALVEAGVHELALLDAEPATPRLTQLVAALKEATPELDVELLALELSDHEALRAALSRFEGRLVGVIHCPRALESAALVRGVVQLDPIEARMREAWNLHRASERGPELAKDLELFVLCTSAEQLLGGPGRARAAAVDGFSRGLIQARRARGLAGQCLGIGAGLDGLVELAPAQLRAAFVAALRCDHEHALAMNFGLRRWRETQLAVAGSPLLAELERDAEPGSQEGTKLAALAPDQRRVVLRELVLDELAQVTGNPRTRIGLDDPLQQLGLDSLMAVELRNRLEARLGVDLSATLIWRHPSARAVATHLDERLDDETSAVPTERPACEPNPPTLSAPANLDKLARLLAAARDCSAGTGREDNCSAGTSREDNCSAGTSREDNSPGSTPPSSAQTQAQEDT